MLVSNRSRKEKIKMALMVQLNMYRLWRSTLIISVNHRSTWRLSLVQQLASSPIQPFQKRAIALSNFSKKSSAPSSNYDVTTKEEENLKTKDNSDTSTNRKIFIGNLLRERNYTSEDKLFKYFSQYGEIEALEFVRSKFSNLPRGYAFVTFRDVESAQRVLAESHFIDNQNVRIEAAENKPKKLVYRKRDLTVLVSSVTKYLDRETIARHFSQFGEVDRVILAEKGDDDLDSYYVVFSTLSGATKALEEPNQRIAEQSIDSQVMALGKTLTVITKFSGRTNCLTITSVPDRLTVEDLRDYFQQYGDVQYADFIVHGGKRSYLHKDSNTAFVRFLDEAVVDKIVKTNDHVINGSEVQVSRYRKLHDLPPEEARELRLSVEGLPLNTRFKEVKKYFEDTYRIVLNGGFFTKKFICIVRFSNQADLEKVLREPKVSFHGFPLHFRRLAWKK